MTLDQIIEALRIERELRGWTYRDVQKAGGPSISAVRNYEHGQKRPSIDRLIAWSTALGYVLVLDLKIRERVAEDG